LSGKSFICFKLKIEQKKTSLKSISDTPLAHKGLWFYAVKLRQLTTLPAKRKFRQRRTWGTYTPEVYRNGKSFICFKLKIEQKKTSLKSISNAPLAHKGL
jgi:hypothetical protein